MTRTLTNTEFGDAFQRFADSPTSTTVFRWEGLQHYSVPHDEPSLVAFRDGTPRPERSVRTSPWLARIATSTAAGKDWSRVHSLVEPLTEYIRWELLAYVESQAAGERILLAGPPPGWLRDTPDFWVFDGTTDADRFAILMHYDTAGAPKTYEYVDDHRVADYLDIAARLTATATPLNGYLAQRPRVTGAA